MYLFYTESEKLTAALKGPLSTFDKKKNKKFTTQT